MISHLSNLPYYYFCNHPFLNAFLKSIRRSFLNALPLLRAV